MSTASLQHVLIFVGFKYCYWYQICFCRHLVMSFKVLYDVCLVPNENMKKVFFWMFSDLIKKKLQLSFIKSFSFGVTINWFLSNWWILAKWTRQNQCGGVGGECGLQWTEVLRYHKSNPSFWTMFSLIKSVHFQCKVTLIGIYCRFSFSKYVI